MLSVELPDLSLSLKFIKLRDVLLRLLLMENLIFFTLVNFVLMLRNMFVPLIPILDCLFEQLVHVEFALRAPLSQLPQLCVNQRHCRFYVPKLLLQVIMAFTKVQINFLSKQ